MAGVVGPRPLIQLGMYLNYDATNPNSYLEGETTVYDLSGNQLNGTVNASYNSSIASGTFTFNGISEYIVTPTLDNLTVYTIEYWVNFQGNSLSGFPGFNSVFGMGSTRRILGRVTGAGDILYQFNGNLDSIVNTRGIWTMQTFSYNTNFTRTRLYTNGILNVETTNQVRNNIIGVGIIGQYGNGTGTLIDGYWMNGYISQFRIYERELTPEEVKNNFNVTKGLHL